MLHRVALLLPQQVADPAISSALTYARSEFDDGHDYDEQTNRSVMLRLALHLAPTDAIAYNTSSPVKRERLIERYLVSELEYPAEHASDLARAVVDIFRLWEAERSKVNWHADALAKRDGNACQSCLVSFDQDTPESAVRIDYYKPYLDTMGGPRNQSLFRRTVDHIEPVAAYGTNDLSNLQLLCELCNRGKGNLEQPLLKHEFEYAGAGIETVPWLFRAQMLFFVLRAKGRRCGSCGSSSRELTIRKVNAIGGYVRTNLCPLCYQCC